MPPLLTLTRLREERASQIQFADELLARVDADGRDLVDAERANLNTTRDRVRELDDQIAPLAEYEALRGDHETAMAPYRGPQERPVARPATDDRQYRSAGAFVVDYMAARGLLSDGRGSRLPADPQAQARVQYALANQTTADTPGLLPEPIIGTVVNLIDASRPFITSIGGGRPMGGIPGKTFGRPRITQHTQVGVQAAEKTELPTRKMIIGEIPFTKATYGGAVDVSRQDIDWTSPSAWDILVRDLADQYAIETENAAADHFVTTADDVNAATPVATNDLQGWSEALYTAAGLVYASSKRLPDRVWVSVDVWGKLGPVIDLQLLSQRSAGASNFDTFAGNLFTVPRIVVPSFPPGTAIVGASTAYEVYEEAIGLLTAVEPSLLGVEVAYGGYIAFNAVIPEALAVLTAPPVGGAARTSGSSTGSKS